MTSPPCVIVIFGATGDLTKRKLIPALYQLHAKGKLHPKTQIIAIGRRDYTAKDLHKELQQFIEKKQQRTWKDCCSHIHYHKLEFHDSAAYAGLKILLAKLEKETSGNRVFYLATAPESFPAIIEQLKRSGIASNNPGRGWHRLVFEKPFGHDLASAHALNREITSLFKESQVYRIDHYLGKEFVQNILVMRFTNPLFEQVWNHQHIDNVQIIVSEKLGVGSRGGYYDRAGALRDMVQNHLLQLLALTAMESPTTLHADDIRDEKVKVLKAVRHMTPAEVRKNLVLGQYTAGKIDGKRVPGYRQEKDVQKNSTTETYVAAKLSVHNKRWIGVPFYLRTGKAMMHSYAEVVVTFKQAPCVLFCGPSGKLEENKIIIRIQPDEGVRLQFNLKEQRTDYSAVPHTMDYSYRAEFGMNTAEAYERLLGDVLRGDQTLFTRWDEVEQAWRVVDNLRAAHVKLSPYAAGSHGPTTGLTLLTRDGRDWSGNKPLRE